MSAFGLGLAFWLGRGIFGSFYLCCAGLIVVLALSGWVFVFLYVLCLRLFCVVWFFFFVCCFVVVLLSCYLFGVCIDWLTSCGDSSGLDVCFVFVGVVFFLCVVLCDGWCVTVAGWVFGFSVFYFAFGGSIYCFVLFGL